MEKRNIKKHTAVTAAPTSSAPSTSCSMTAKKPPEEADVTMPEKNTNSATPTPSLNSDSPWIKKEMFFGKPNLLRMLVAAIGSVGAAMLPNIRQTGSERFSPSSSDAP